jgi:hypothetical protein
MKTLSIKIPPGKKSNTRNEVSKILNTEMNEEFFQNLLNPVSQEKIIKLKDSWKNLVSIKLCLQFENILNHSE